uniref:Uncharacterized protein n=1 Tax=Triticum urartu TaxID=4572 RepID=A0A8R7UE88_TRIUA
MCVAVAAMGMAVAGYGICHGRSRGSSGGHSSWMSMATPLNSSTTRSTWLTERSRSPSSAARARSTVFSWSTRTNCPVMSLARASTRAFSALRRATSCTSSSRCCCFRSRDRRADSRFDSRLFSRRLSPAANVAPESPSEPDSLPPPGDSDDDDILAPESLVLGYYC